MQAVNNGVLVWINQDYFLYRKDGIYYLHSISKMLPFGDYQSVVDYLSNKYVSQDVSDVLASLPSIEFIDMMVYLNEVMNEYNYIHQTYNDMLYQQKLSQINKEDFNRQFYGDILGDT